VQRLGLGAGLHKVNSSSSTIASSATAKKTSTCSMLSLRRVASVKKSSFSHTYTVLKRYSANGHTCFEPLFSSLLCYAIILSAGEEKNVKTKGLIIWSLLLRRLVVAMTTKPNLGHLASASEVAGGHTIPF
jgi:hypothetical protein